MNILKYRIISRISEIYGRNLFIRIVKLRKMLIIFFTKSIYVSRKNYLTFNIRWIECAKMTMTQVYHSHGDYKTLAMQNSLVCTTV